ncbi:hypothetical protein H5J24_09370 [Chryseobacterium capnotolerans]|uniref:hypothetical protein n=1 Tax=Chryseobacterium TaxID=59732 RepID=UPI00083AF0C5|nr:MULTISPECIES: hypothetical protein [Chryseobacterium]UHO40178.1 hypothetical protein H5J24_09370 [Chryseobacterium capnotolerans]
MAISKKNKSKVHVDGKEYLWWVFDEYDQTEFDGIQIKAVCSDQTHFIKYGLQQEEDHRKLALILKDYTRLVHLSSPPKFEDSKGIITKSGIIRMIEWCKQDIHDVRYALDGKNNNLSESEKQELLKEIRKIIT